MKKTPEGFALTYISSYSFKIVTLLLSAPLLTLSELLRLTLRWLTRATPSSAACVYFRHPPTSYLSTFPLSAHDLSRTRFRARSPGCPSEAELKVECLNSHLLPYTTQAFGRLG